MNNSPPPIWVFALFPILFVGMWLLVSFLVSAIGGWKTLGESYASDTGKQGQAILWRSASLGLASYNHCVNFHCSPEGLGMSVMLIFRPAHPPLFIPWNEVSASTYEGWFAEYVDLRFAKVPDVTVRVTRRLAEKILATGGSPIAITGHG